jgi:hypothetical protein
MKQPKFSEVLRAAAKGLRQVYSTQARYPQMYQDSNYGQSGSRFYGPGQLEAENASYREGEAKAAMFDSIAELYEKYEQQEEFSALPYEEQARRQSEQLKR